MQKSSLSYNVRGDRVVVRRLEAPKQVDGGLIVPRSQQKELNEGVVLAIGAGWRNPATGQIQPIEDIEIGQEVLFLDFAGSEITIDGEKLLSLKNEEIHGSRPIKVADNRTSTLGSMGGF